LIEFRPPWPGIAALGTFINQNSRHFRKAPRHAVPGIDGGAGKNVNLMIAALDDGFRLAISGLFAVKL
jgi:hypothetical protein